ncbi:MAG: carbon-nitrogen hydrolase [Verrucomicrobiae bacterium]|nr:carbon-nitrogen hydrolase [Verrucomicrobiae bacterium]
MPTSSPVKIGLIQSKNSAAPAENVERALAKIDEVAAKGAQIVCLQEIFNTLYFCQHEDERYFELAESIPGPVTDRMCEKAKEHGIVLIVPIFERRAPGLFHNSAAIIDADGTMLGVYRKMHIPDDPQFMEKYYFTPGDYGFRAWDTRFGRIGVCICWDQWYPEAARLTAMAGAEILFYPTAIGWIPADENSVREAQHSAWETMQRSHAIANGCFVAAPNRVGLEGSPGGETIQFWGRSFVAGPSGEVIARASGDDEDILVVDADLSAIERQRIAWPFFRDRRIDAYQGLLRRFGSGDPSGL